MSGIKISNLPASTTPLNGSELVPLVQGGTTKNATVTQIGTVIATGALTARALPDRFAETYSVADFGAVGDGITDDTAAIQAAINAAGAGGTVYLEKNRVYKCLDTLTIAVSNFTFDGNGSTINGSARAAATALNQIYALKVEGSTTGSPVAATADIAEGTVAVTLVSTSTLAADDLVFVYSQDKYPSGATNTNTTCGAVHYVRSTDSATNLTLFEGAYFNYTVVNGASVQKLMPVENVTIRNLTVVMGGVNKAHCGIRFKYATRCAALDCRVSDTEDVGLRFDTTLYCSATGGSYINTTSPDAGTSGVTGITGYGIYSADASRGTRLTKVYFRNNRHAVAGGGRYPSIDTDVFECLVDGGRAASYPRTYSLDCHEDCLYWTFSNNHVAGANLSTGSGGINLRGQNCAAINNVVANAWQYGIYVRNYDNPGVSNGNVVTGNTITNSRLDGIYVQGFSTATQSNVRISGNSIFNCGGNGIALSGTAGATVSDNLIIMGTGANTSGIRLIGTAATTGNQCTDAVVSNNTIQSPTVHGIRADYAARAVFSNNAVKSAGGEGIALTNCSDVSVTGGTLQVINATRSGVFIDTCTRVAVSGVHAETTATASGVSSGAYVLGASTDVAVGSCVFKAFNHGVYSAAPADYLTVAGVNARTSVTASVDVSASANTSTAGNL